MKKELLMSLGVVLSLAGPSFASQPDASLMWKVHTQAVALSDQRLKKACPWGVWNLRESIRVATDGVPDYSAPRAEAMGRLSDWREILQQFCSGSDEIQLFGDPIKVNDRNLKAFVTLVIRDSEIVLAGTAIDEGTIWDAYEGKVESASK